MSRKVKVSKPAERKLNKLLDYLHENWSQKVKSDFIKKFDNVIHLISSNPTMFPESKEYPGLYKCVITKQTSLYYKFNAETVIIVTFFDTRQHPLKLRKSLK
jgi:plasmid stabilization system protein ParE